MYKPTSVEDYFSTLDPKTKSDLNKLRERIKKIVPEAKDGISYGMPALLYKGKAIAGYGAFKDHYSYFPMSGSVVGKLQNELKEYKTLKGTVSYPIGDELPDDILKKLLQTRMKEIDSHS